MNDRKLELARKKAQLAEMHTRKLAREVEKRTRVDGFTQTKFSYKTDYDSNNSIDIIKTFPESKQPSSEFDKLNADEILDKVGVFIESSDNTLFTPSVSVSSVLDDYADDSMVCEESITKRM